MYAVQYASQKIWWHPEGFNRISLMARGGKGTLALIGLIRLHSCPVGVNIDY